jgi:hypothetical protein
LTSQNISADLLDAACNPIAVLRPQTKGFQDHQRKRSFAKRLAFLSSGNPPLGFQQE